MPPRSRNVRTLSSNLVLSSLKLVILLCNKVTGQNINFGQYSAILPVTSCLYIYLAAMRMLYTYFLKFAKHLNVAWKIFTHGMIVFSERIITFSQPARSWLTHRDSFPRRRTKHCKNLIFRNLRIQQLHLFPVSQRIVFRLLLLVYKSIKETGPSYLTYLLDPYQQEHYNLRSTNLHIETKTNTDYGDHAFCVCGWKLWRELPLCIRESGSTEVFKSTIDTPFQNCIL